MPMTNDEWVAAWDAASVNARYGLVEAEARKILTTAEATMETAQLVEAMFPAMGARGNGNLVRKAIVTHLVRMAKTNLKDCAAKDMSCEPRMWYGKPVRPWVWSRSAVVKREPCPCCHGKGYLAEGDSCQAAPAA